MPTLDIRENVQLLSNYKHYFVRMLLNTFFLIYYLTAYLNNNDSSYL